MMVKNVVAVGIVLLIAWAFYEGDKFVNGTTHCQPAGIIQVDPEKRC